MTTWLYPAERRYLWSRRRRAIIAVLLVYIVMALLDHAAYRWWHAEGPGLEKLEGRDWYRLLRVLGTMWTWVLVASAMALAGHTGRAVRLLAASGLAGIIAELLKFPVGRLRPSQSDGAYEYLGWTERFAHQAHGGPSSHAAVAFGALTFLGFLWPRTMPLMLLAAAACAATRVVAGAHFLTDVYAGGLCGLVCAGVLRPRTADRGVLLP
ncbi:MAG: phosphatase PAP2 family protein [Phycisphaerales bacterium]|nr:phosphatase PAP2 family protein [Phycisphaerales bacterium]